MNDHSQVFTCQKCGQSFSTQSARLNHEKHCTNLVFIDNELFDLHVLQDEPPTYRTLLQQAAQRNPTYMKYANRANPGEPDDMQQLYMRLRKKEIDERKEEERLCGESRKGAGSSQADEAETVA